MKFFLAVIIFALALAGLSVLFIKNNHSTAGQVQAVKNTTQKVSESDKKVYIPEPVTVNLPVGEEFMRMISKEEALNLGFSTKKLYVTRNHEHSRVTFWCPGGHPGAWEALLYIQEH